MSDQKENPDAINRRAVEVRNRLQSEPFFKAPEDASAVEFMEAWLEANPQFMPEEAFKGRDPKDCVLFRGGENEKELEEDVGTTMYQTYEFLSTFARENERQQKSEDRER